MSASEIVNKVWNYAHVLRDDGVGYGLSISLKAPVEAVPTHPCAPQHLGILPVATTFLIFLKIADEREESGQQVAVPKKYSGSKLVKLDGDALKIQYRHTLEELGKQSRMLGTSFRKAQNKVQGRFTYA